jgi:LacI family transcriptional regulator
VTRYVPGVQADYVGNDNRVATEIATNHLLDLGHEHLAYVGLTRSTSTGRERVAGFRQAMKLRNATLREDWVVECDATRTDGFQALLSLFKARDRPSGIVCFDDDIAFGVMLGLRSLGLEPGRDCSVIGIDDYPEAALWRPGLTTVAIERKKIGQLAGRMLIDRIEDSSRPVENVVLSPRLVARESSGPPAASTIRARRA